jgi:hypothetical protein
MCCMVGGDRRLTSRNTAACHSNPVSSLTAQHPWPVKSTRVTGHVPHHYSVPLMLEFVLPSSTLHKPRSASVFSPIGFREFDPQKYREFVQTLSDEEPKNS